MLRTLPRWLPSVVLLLSVVTVTTTARGQDQPVTTADPAVAVNDLEALLLPLTQAELVIEVNGWIELLQEKVGAISAAEIGSRAAEGEAKTTLLNEAGTLREQRTEIIDRTNAAIEALREKGGDVEVFEKYVSAVSGLTVDVTDAGAAWTTIQNWVTSKEGGVRWGTNIALFLVTLIVFRILGRIVSRIVGRALSKVKKTSDLLRQFLVTIVDKAIFVVGIVVALSMLEVNVGPFLAAIGAVGFILGFALQGTLSNFAAGVMILMYRPFDLGDWVNVAGVSGSVKAMTLVSTTIKTGDNQTVIVPNNSIWGGVITNVTGDTTRRVDMTFGIGYSDDMEKAQTILLDILNGHELVLADPAPVVQVHELADSSVNYVVRPWVKTSDYWTVYWDVTRGVKERFDAEGISIPFPQQDVHMHQVSP